MKKTIKTQVMDFVAANGGTATFTQIQKFIVEEIKGGTYDRSQRGWHSTSFRPASSQASDWWGIGYFLKPGREPRYLRKTEDGSYILIENISQ